MIDIKTHIKNIGILKKEYKKWNAPVVTLIALHYDDPYRILISTILSLRTKDEVTAAASKRLFEVADVPEEMIKLTASQIEKLVYPAGFYKRKSVQIIDISKRIISEFNSTVPDTLEELLSFKGVGRKTANLVLSLGYNKDAICVDTHVHRISNRWGLVTNTKDPEATEYELMEKLPKAHWREINDLMVAFGQTICRPVSPKCELCPLPNGCPARVLKKK